MLTLKGRTMIITGGAGNDGTAIVTLSSITDLIYHFHSCVHSSIEADCIFAARNIVIDSSGNSYALNTLCGKISCSSERTVAAYYNYARYSKLTAKLRCFLNSLGCIIFGASCCVQHCTASVYYI